MSKDGMSPADLQGMDLVDVAALTVEAAGGAKAVAGRIGKGVSALQHELNPALGGNFKLGLRTAETIMHRTGDYRILQAMAQNCGFMVLPLPQLGEESSEISDKMADLAREFADVVGAVATAIRNDGKVSDNELHEITRQWSELMAVGPDLFDVLEANNRRHGGQGLGEAVHTLQAGLKRVA